MARQTSLDMRALSLKKSGSSRTISTRRRVWTTTMPLKARRSGAPQTAVAPGVDSGCAWGAVHEGRLAKGGASHARDVDKDPTRRAAVEPLAPAAAARTLSAPASTT